MRASAAFLAGAGSAAILAVGWNAGASALAHSTTTTSTTQAASSSGTSSSAKSATQTSASQSSSAPAASASPSPTPTPTQSTPSVADGTYTGQAINYRYGTIQLNVVISGGQITDVQPVQAGATNGRQAAFPMLTQEVLQAQSANIGNLSGATMTTMAYQQSLQSALDAAGWQG